MNNKILVTGGNGLVGTALKDCFKNQSNIFWINSKNDCDLTEMKNIRNKIGNMKFDTIIHLAANVGGIEYNEKNNKSIFDVNHAINSNMIKLAEENQGSFFINLSSSCIYPEKYMKTYLKENVMFNGEPSRSNFGYSYAKRIMMKQLEIYNIPHVSLISSNIFGHHDHYDSPKSHVIPALISKIFKAKQYKKRNLVLFGTGNEEREFIYNKHLAIIIKKIAMINKKYLEHNSYNIGHCSRQTIKQIAQTICYQYGYDFKKINWSKEFCGVQQKRTSQSRIKQFIKNNGKFINKINFHNCLISTCQFYRDNFNNIKKQDFVSENLPKSNLEYVISNEKFKFPWELNY